MDYAELKTKIEATINGLDDKSVILLDAGDLGLAVFPRTGEVICDQNFIDGRWTDQAVRSYWTGVKGQGRLVCTIGCGDEPLEDMICPTYNRDDDYECELEKKLADPSWVREYARKTRAAMLRELQYSVDSVIDFCKMEEEW